MRRNRPGMRSPGGVIIALDYDDTYDCDPLFWDQLIAAAARCGHTVIVVTMRHEHERPVIPAWPDMPIFCTGREPKVRTCGAAASR